MKEQQRISVYLDKDTKNELENYLFLECNKKSMSEYIRELIEKDIKKGEKK